MKFFLENLSSDDSPNNGSFFGEGEKLQTPYSVIDLRHERRQLLANAVDREYDRGALFRVPSRAIALLVRFAPRVIRALSTGKATPLFRSYPRICLLVRGESFKY